MRLDEWQKWLDQQWLDDEEEAKPTPPDAPAEPAVQAADQPAPAELAMPATTPGASAQAAPPPAVEPVAAPPPIATQPLAPTAASGPGPAFPPIPTPAPRIPHPVETTTDDEPALPSIGSFLPSRRRAAEPDQPVAAPPAPVPAPPAAQVATPEPRPVTAPIAPVAPVAPPAVEIAAAPVAEPAELPQPESAFEEPAAEEVPGIAHGPAIEAAVAPEAASTPVTSPEHSATPRTRRQRKPASVPAVSLEAAELWALVPRHIRTLVAMDGEETAQRSYKRQFRESRLELVQRLLDPTLSLEDTARLLNVCPTTVRRYTNKGLLTHQRTTGDQRRFRLSDVLAFLEAQGDSNGKTGEP